MADKQNARPATRAASTVDPFGDDLDEIVSVAGEDAGPEAKAAEARMRVTRADTTRPEDGAVRQAAMRASSWAPPNVLPVVSDKNGWHYRWVRLSTRGEADDLNVNQSFREGYVPATMEDVGSVHMSYEKSEKFPGGIEIGGLLLCKIPQETVDARNAYYTKQALGQVEGLENDMLRQNDPRMPLLRPQRSTRTTFGSGL